MQYSGLGELIQRQIERNKIRFTAKDIAPNTFADLKRECTTTSLVVWAGASEGTIYGAPDLNHAFRAWHDSIHIRFNLPFNLDGEREAALIQAQSLGDIPGRIILAEVYGQALYAAKHGAFPTDQAAFIAAYLKDGKV